MKLIAFLEVLFVIASCSDSDMPNNFAVSCHKVSELTGFEKAESWTFDFDFDNNIVTSNPYYDNGKKGFAISYDITEIRATHIHFGNSIEEYTFNRSDLRLSYFDDLYGVISTIDYRCRLPQV